MEDLETTQAVGNARSRLAIRTRRARIEAGRDIEMLRWVSRFRFVTAVGLAERFGVSQIAIRNRAVRLEAQGLLGITRPPQSAWSYYVSRAGGERLGLPPRNPPRVEAQREHELAIVWQVAHFEKQQNPRVEVLTERECRARESEGLGPFHARVAGEQSGGTRGQRWPDLVLVIDGHRRVAIELELSAKHTPRLQRIVAGYLLSDYHRVIFYVDDLPLARRLAQLRDAQIARHASGRPPSLGPLQLPRFDVEPWPHAHPERIEPIRAWFAATTAAQQEAA